MGLKKVTFVPEGKKNRKPGLLIGDGVKRGSVIIRTPNKDKDCGYSETTMSKKKCKVEIAE